MNRQQSILTARALTDASDRLLTAEDPLAELHHACGGSLPGMLAIPELLELVRHSRRMDLKIAREFSAFDGEDVVSGFARIHPLSEEEGGGCEVLVENWHRAPAQQYTPREYADRLDAVDRAAAEVTARLDARQHVQFLNTDAHDTDALRAAFERAPGKAWSEYVELAGIAHQQPLHWRLLDGSHASIPGSERDWRVRLIPIGPLDSAPRGFELLLVAEEPLRDDHNEAAATMDDNDHSRLIGSSLTPVLRQPIARIIANAETIRARLAGPLREEYSDYAGNIAAAGQHLSGMLDDLADLEVVEAPGFKTAKERVDLADVARRAAGILGVRAQDREITIIVAKPEAPIMAIGEFRRVLQVLINLIGNAIAYSPEGSTVTVTVCSAGDGTVETSVIDQGSGVDAQQAGRIFDKFERLGRDGDGGNDSGSGLGLYISRRLARAMEGELEVVEPGADDDHAGAEFRLTLPAAK